MPITSTSAITYESRLIDSGNARAIFKVTTTTTVTTAPDTPVGTTVSESLQFESVDYTQLYASIANSLGSDSTTISGILASSSQALENIEMQLKNIKELAAGPGIRMISPYEWLGLVSSYKLYVEDDGAIGIDALREYKDKINSLPKSF